MTLFEEIMDKYGVQYTGIDVLEKLNDAYPCLLYTSSLMRFVYVSKIELLNRTILQSLWWEMEKSGHKKSSRGGEL